MKYCGTARSPCDSTAFLLDDVPTRLLAYRILITIEMLRKTALFKFITDADINRPCSAWHHHHCITVVVVVDDDDHGDYDVDDVDDHWDDETAADDDAVDRDRLRRPGYVRVISRRCEEL